MDPNDGIISISSLAIGAATTSLTREPIILATVAGLEIEREIQELRDMPEIELQILAQIYEKRGLEKRNCIAS